MDNFPRKKPRTAKHPMPADGVCTFPGCGWVCKSQKISTYAMHITKKHSAPVTSYECPVCAETFTVRSDLKRHCEVNHEPRKWNCYECDYVSKNQSTLVTHIVRKHKGYNHENQCIHPDGTCVICKAPRPSTGHFYHIGVCLGVKDMVHRHNQCESRREE
jgi:uncharacterized C2H2 Zn-finger protein